MATCDRKASDPKDKDFALLGLLDEHRELDSLTIDYSQTVSTVYQKAMMAAF